MGSKGQACFKDGTKRPQWALERLGHPPPSNNSERGRWLGSRKKKMSFGHDLEAGTGRAWNPGAGGHDALLGFSGMWLRSLGEDISREKRWLRAGEFEKDQRV